jgi:hypothetical protein
MSADLKQLVEECGILEEETDATEEAVSTPVGVTAVQEPQTEVHDAQVYILVNEK